MTVLKLSHAAVIRTRSFCYLEIFLAEHTIRDTAQGDAEMGEGDKRMSLKLIKRSSAHMLSRAAG